MSCGKDRISIKFAFIFCLFGLIEWICGSRFACCMLLNARKRSLPKVFMKKFYPSVLLLWKKIPPPGKNNVWMQYFEIQEKLWCSLAKNLIHDVSIIPFNINLNLELMLLAWIINKQCSIFFHKKWTCFAKKYFHVNIFLHVKKWMIHCFILFWYILSLAHV